MFSQRFWRCITVYVILAVAPIPAGGQSTSELPFDPQDGETVVFLGDSITHQTLYTQYVEDFFITRYPDRSINFHNAGVSGDKAADALLRFDEDVARHNPDYVTVLLGMNDGQYQPFREETFAAYERDMQKLMERISDIGARAIVLSPTMFDHQQVRRRRDDESWRFRQREFSPHYNALMAFYGGWLLEQAGRRKLPFVNLWGPLNEHSVAQRRDDPQFTLVGDAIHPQESGQVVMAFEILSQLGVSRRTASSLVISRRGDRWVGRGTNNLVFDDDTKTLTFDYQARSLPWVLPNDEGSQRNRWQLPADAAVGYRITRAGHKLSADRFKVVGLPPGNYDVLIDDISVGTWSHAALGTKIELQENSATPQYQQALHVAELNRQRSDKFVRPLRDKWGTIKGIRRRYANDPDQAARLLAKARAAADDHSAQADAMLTKIRAAAQPRTHRWTVRPAQAESASVRNVK